MDDGNLGAAASRQVQVPPVSRVQSETLPRAGRQGGLESELAAVQPGQLHRPVGVEETSVGRS